MLYRTKMFWDWQQCTARGGKIFVHLTGMICPWAGNLMANFWKMPNQVIQMKQANLATSSLSQSLCKVIKAHFVHFWELRRGRLVARPQELWHPNVFNTNGKFGVKLYPTLLGLSDKASLETLVLNSVEQYHKREKFDIQRFFYVLDVNFFIA